MRKLATWALQVICFLARRSKRMTHSKRATVWILKLASFVWPNDTKQKLRSFLIQRRHSSYIQNFKLFHSHDMAIITRPYEEKLLKVIWASPTFLRLTGYSLTELNDGILETAFVRRERDSLQHRLGQILDGSGQQQIEYQITTANDELRYMMVFSEYVKGDNYIFTVAQDITAERQLEAFLD